MRGLQLQKIKLHVSQQSDAMHSESRTEQRACIDDHDPPIGEFVFDPAALIVP